MDACSAITTAQGTHNCPGLPVCSCKACSQINLWGRGASGYKLILLSGLLSRAENQHSQAHKCTYSHKNTHWWCQIPTLCPPSVGPGAGWVEDGWWHHSPSRSELRLRLWVNGGLIGTSIKHTHALAHTAHLPISQTPTAQRKILTNTALFYFILLPWEQGMRSALLSHCRCGPALTLCWTHMPCRPLCKRMCDVCVCVCSVCVE